jgi:hypothetical protein
MCSARKGGLRGEADILTFILCFCQDLHVIETRRETTAFKPSPFPFLPFWRRGAATTIIVDAEAPLETPPAEDGTCVSPSLCFRQMHRCCLYTL